MKVLLLKDVYKLGRAGDVKKVADGYGRNFLLPKNLAVLATAGALKQADHIREHATIQRAALNQEMSSVAEVLAKLVLVFPSKAGETGKLYGSITPQMIVDAIKAKSGIEVERHQIDVEPIRTLGEKKAHVRLTVDLMPEVLVIVHREGEAIAEVGEPVVEAVVAEAEVVEAPVVEVPVVEEPVVETPVVEEPVVEAPVKKASKKAAKEPVEETPAEEA